MGLVPLRLTECFRDEEGLDLLKEPFVSQIARSRTEIASNQIAEDSIVCGPAARRQALVRMRKSDDTSTA